MNPAAIEQPQPYSTHIPLAFAMTLSDAPFDALPQYRLWKHNRFLPEPPVQRPQPGFAHLNFDEKR